MKDTPHLPKRMHTIVWWGSRALAGIAGLNAAYALFAHWAVNAQGLGKHDPGLALALAFSAGVSLLASGAAALALILIAGGVALFQRSSALWLLAAAAASALPIAIHWR